jgi:hypothetical protein
MAIAGCVLVFSGAAQNESGKHIRAESLEIIDDSGAVRLRLGKLEAPKPLEAFGFVAKDTSGKTCVAIHDLAQVNLYKGDGTVFIGADNNGGQIQVAAAGTKPRAMIGVTECSLQLRDSNGEVSFEKTTPRIQVPRDARRAADPFAP